MNGCQVSSPPDCHGGLSVKMMNLAINKKRIISLQIKKNCQFITWETTSCPNLEGQTRKFQYNSLPWAEHFSFGST